MYTRRERIIELATQIAGARERVRVMEAEMDRLLPSEQGAAPLTPTAKPVPAFTTDSSGGPLTERLIKFLKLNRGRTFSAGQIATGIELASDKMNSLRSTLVRLVDEDRIERPKPGLYCAKSEQHNAAA